MRELNKLIRLPKRLKSNSGQVSAILGASILVLSLFAFLTGINSMLKSRTEGNLQSTANAKLAIVLDELNSKAFTDANYWGDGKYEVDPQAVVSAETGERSLASVAKKIPKDISVDSNVKYEIATSPASSNLKLIKLSYHLANREILLSGFKYKDR